MQKSATYQGEFSKQINTYKELITTQPHEVCIDRAKLITDYYKNSHGENESLKYANSIAYILNKMEIKIWDNEYIVGNRCSKIVGTPLFPEVRVDIIEQDVDTYENREAQKLFISDEDKTLLKEKIIPYWKSERATVKEMFISSLPEDTRKVKDTLLFTVETEMTNGVGHFFPGHEVLLEHGINGIIQKAKENLSIYNKDHRKKEFLQSVVILYEAAKNFIKRYSKLAIKLSNSDLSDTRKTELVEISEICKNISEFPPKSFKEALQIVFFNQVICGIEDGGYAISVGRLDQLLIKYYKNDLQEGKISKNEVIYLLSHFYLKLCTLWNYIFYLGVNAAEGPPIAENLTIGGVNSQGVDATNELSYIMLEAYANLKTVQPTFSIRVHRNSPPQLLSKAYEAIRMGASIALFNDDVMIPALVNRGFSLEDAREYAPIGCVEPQHPFKSFGSTNANQFNIAKCLELALNNGTDTFLRRPIGLIYDDYINSFADLWNRFRENTSYFIEKMVECMRYLDNTIATLTPHPFLSGTTLDCIERGLDITEGGAIYDFTGPQLVGLATVADSFAVIKKLVFEENLISLEDLRSLLGKNYRGNYLGKKGEEWRQLFINKVPKFGNDDDYVDQIAVEVADFYCEEISKYTNYRGGKYNPGIYSTSLHLAFGSFTGASADGRKSRSPLSNGLCPTHGRDKKGPTAILNSVRKLNHGVMTNGNSLILAFHPNTIKEENFTPLIQSFFEQDGGFQIQFNVVGKETLCDAQLYPEQHRGLVVRIAGYSVLFTELSKNAQDEIIARTEY